MQRYAWNMVQRKMRETLDIYPKVKGMQILNDMGQYMFPIYAGKWIPDTPARRAAVLKRLASWNAFSNSSPVEGIERAIRTFAVPGRKLSLYVFGDEFTGDSIDAVVDRVEEMNPRGPDGGRRVRIHAVGFPVMFGSIGAPEHTGVRFRDPDADSVRAPRRQLRGVGRGPVTGRTQPRRAVTFARRSAVPFW